MNGNGNVSIKWYATRLVCVPRILNLVLFHLVQFIIFENPTKQADRYVDRYGKSLKVKLFSKHCCNSAACLL